MIQDIHVSTYIQIKNLRWAGHVTRMEDSHIPNKILGWIFRGRS